MCGSTRAASRPENHRLRGSSLPPACLFACVFACGALSCGPARTPSLPRAATSQEDARAPQSQPLLRTEAVASTATEVRGPAVVTTPAGARLNEPEGFLVMQRGPVLELNEPDRTARVFPLRWKRETPLRPSAKPGNVRTRAPVGKSCRQWPLLRPRATRKYASRTTCGPLTAAWPRPWHGASAPAHGSLS